MPDEAEEETRDWREARWGKSLVREMEKTRRKVRRKGVRARRVGMLKVEGRQEVEVEVQVVSESESGGILALVVTVARMK